VRPTRRLAGVTLQQKAVLRHQAVNAFVVEPVKPRALTLSIEQRPDPMIGRGPSIIPPHSDNGQDLCILRPRASPARATPCAKTQMKLRTRDAERIGDRLHSKPLLDNDDICEISFFSYVTFPASQKLSFSNVLLPNIDSCFQMRSLRILASEEPTTSSSS